MDVVVERVAGLDVHQKTVMAAVRTPGTGSSRHKEVRDFTTLTGGLVTLRDWLVEQAVTLVVMAATGVHGRPVCHLHEEQRRSQLQLVNRHHVKNVPGRKIDTEDSAWLAHLAECGLLRGSFVPPKQIAAARGRRGQADLCGHRRDGVSGRAMIEALIAGECDPDKLANLALTRMRPKIPRSSSPSSAASTITTVCSPAHLDHIDRLTAVERRLDDEVDRLMIPFADAAALLRSVTGIGKRTAAIVIAEIDIDMSRFPSARHLAELGRPWPPGTMSQLASEVRGGRRATSGCEPPCARPLGRRPSWRHLPSARYRRFKRRFGTKSEGKAIFDPGPQHDRDHVGRAARSDDLRRARVRSLRAPQRDSEPPALSRQGARASRQPRHPRIHYRLIPSVCS